MPSTFTLILAAQKSGILMELSVAMTKLSDLRSLWIISKLCKYSMPLAMSRSLFYNKLQWDNSGLLSTEKWPYWSTLCILSQNAPRKVFRKFIPPTNCHTILMFHSCKHCNFFRNCRLHHHCYLHIVLWSLQDLLSYFLSTVGSPVELSKCTLCKSLAHVQALQIKSIVQLL